MQTCTVYQPSMKSQAHLERGFSYTTGFELHVRMPKPTEKASQSPLPAGKAPSSCSPKMTCLCAPTTHAGSFRCRFHRAMNKAPTEPHGSDSQHSFSEAKSCLSHKPENKSVGKVFRRLSAMEERSKGESSLSTPPLRSKNFRKPSRLSKVTFARDIKEEDNTISPETAMQPPAIHPKHSKRASSIESISSVRLMALKKCQSLMKEDILRVRLSVHTCSQPILSR